MSYSSEDYDAALASHEGRASACVDYKAKVAAALRIASAVTRPGVIEGELKALTNEVDLDWTGEDAAVRQALTEAKDG